MCFWSWLGSVLDVQNNVVSLLLFGLCDFARQNRSFPLLGCDERVTYTGELTIGPGSTDGFPGSIRFSLTDRRAILQFAFQLLGHPVYDVSMAIFDQCLSEDTVILVKRLEPGREPEPNL